jgi:hypothetical protein
LPDKHGFNVVKLANKPEIYMKAWEFIAIPMASSLCRFVLARTDAHWVNRLPKKSDLFCHSERSEESLFGLNAGKERFLGAQRASA